MASPFLRAVFAVIVQPVRVSEPPLWTAPPWLSFPPVNVTPLISTLTPLDIEKKLTTMKYGCLCLECLNISI